MNFFKRKMGEVPPTRRPGKRAIDHVWVTPGAFSAVSRAGIVGQEEVFLSDHAGLFVDLKVGDLGMEEDPDNRQPRYLKSENSKNVEVYLNLVRKRVEEESPKERMKDLKRGIRLEKLRRGGEYYVR